MDLLVPFFRIQSKRKRTTVTLHYGNWCRGKTCTGWSNVAICHNLWPGCEFKQGFVLSGFFHEYYLFLIYIQHDDTFVVEILTAFFNSNLSNPHLKWPFSSLSPLISITKLKPNNHLAVVIDNQPLTKHKKSNYLHLTGDQFSLKFNWGKNYIDSHNPHTRFHCEKKLTISTFWVYSSVKIVHKIPNLQLQSHLVALKT